MKILLNAKPFGPGPTSEQLLALLGADGGEIALLEGISGKTLLAVEPLLVLEMDAQGHLHWQQPQWPDLPRPVLEKSLGRLWDDPLSNWDRLLSEVQLEVSHPGLPVGWIGGISYDLGRLIEAVGETSKDDLAWPLARLTLFSEYYLLDHQSGEWMLISGGMAGESAPRLAKMEKRLQEAHRLGISPGAMGACRALETPSRQEYLRRAGEVLRYIGQGDIYQANLAQRWVFETDTSPVAIYQRLRRESPSEYGAFLRFDNRCVLSVSPELFLERRGTRLLTQPIKGTRPRDAGDPQEDQRLSQELLASAKDQAELAMIVDLLRNDLGRVCRYGSVQVREPRHLEAHPTLWHTSAQIEGQLLAHLNPGGWGAIIRALCPGGSITGAPKIRAMQILDELEGQRRGLYCGHIGWLRPDAGVLNIAIRTILMHGTKAYVHAGGGIVADSDPESEYQETLLKAAALLRALGAG